ncbi:major facilitator superfamily domain-containing protein [Microdochium trichocladiopsis]|uniref:Major facilitator superfamily domain-containing protein n=1 Tax=Microdochium trichocladiopsis TaxID=1682393 RepID=A0A9P8Y656_9PEZI|nr:major facilitator superfamily domain-containing protein [Microdochium trichocladiopsis]KAH7031046.1 major facilitator superfamily domain-containing protein [Microdochium trichocladiopsis]
MGRSTGFRPSAHQWAIMAMLSVISLMVALDATIIVTCLNAMIHDLNSTSTEGFWIGTSYLLSSAVTMPFTASLSDTFGRRPSLIAALLFFTGGTLFCSLAPKISVMLAGRCLQGIGGGGIMVITTMLFTDLLELRDRAKYYGLVLAAWAIGNCIGPILGGLFVDKTSWRWAFHVMYPFCGIGLLSIPWLLTFHTPPGSLKAKASTVDWLGAILFVSAATLLLVGLSCAGTVYPWDAPLTIVLLCLGMLGLVGTFVWERYYCAAPFMKHTLFQTYSQVAANICGVLQGTIIFGQLYYVPLYFLVIRGFSPLNTGVCLLPVTFTLAPTSILVGRLISQMKEYRTFIWCGWATTAVGSGLLVLWNSETSTAQWALTLTVLGVGHGAVLNSQGFASQALCRHGEEGAAAGMYAFLRQFGMALGVGIGGSVFQNSMASELSSEGLPTQLANDISAAEAFLADSPRGNAVVSSIFGSLLYGFRYVNILYTTLSLLAFCISVPIQKGDMDKGINTEHSLQDLRPSISHPWSRSRYQSLQHSAEALAAARVNLNSTQSPTTPRRLAKRSIRHPYLEIPYCESPGPVYPAVSQIDSYHPMPTPVSSPELYLASRQPVDHLSPSSQPANSGSGRLPIIEESKREAIIPQRTTIQYWI